MSSWNEKIIQEFRENDGKVGGHFSDVTLALLHTLGAKSGKTRITPLICLQDGDNYIVVASNSGSENHPDWYHNILANSDVTVEFGTEKFEAVARPVEGPEHSDLYVKMEKFFKIFTEYRTNTTRKIPVVKLTKK
jgi:deazaflavin-dependent oxidoreductase (nitroreductase family)